jgi:hypothetical protein
MMLAIIQAKLAQREDPLLLENKKMHAAKSSEFLRVKIMI